MGNFTQDVIDYLSQFCRGSLTYKGTLSHTFGGVNVSIEPSLGILTVSGKLRPLEGDDYSFNGSWSYEYATRTYGENVVAVSGIDASDNHFFLEMSDGTTIVFNKYGIVGKTFRVEDKPKTKKDKLDRLMDVLSEVRDVCDSIINDEDSEEIDSDLEPVWIEKNGNRFKVPKSSLSQYIEEGFTISPKKKTKK